MVKEKMVVHIESPFFRDELVRMIHDSGSRFMDNEQVQHIPQMIDIINKRIKKGFIGGFSHVYLTVRYQEFKGAHKRHPSPSITNRFYIDDDHNEVVVTASLLDWLFFVRTNKGEMAKAVRNWIDAELKGINTIRIRKEDTHNENTEGK